MFIESSRNKNLVWYLVILHKTPARVNYNSFVVNAYSRTNKKKHVPTV